MPSLLAKDLARLKKLAKRAWWLGILAGLACNVLPPDYRTPCKAIANACSKLIPSP